MGPPRVPVGERLLKHSRVDPVTGCRVWTAGLDWKGYGQIKADGRTRRVHRVAWEHAKGPIPAGLDVLHNCPHGDNRACIEIEHLWLGTNQDNVDDKIRKGRQSHKGPQGEDHPRAVLTEVAVRAIRADGRRNRIIAAEHGVRKDTIARIKRHESWRHI